MSQRSNETLKDLYDRVFREGKESFFSRYADGTDLSENDMVVLSAAEWKDKTVLDVGCGTGHTIARIAAEGAKHATGIDYAQSAIEAATKIHSAPNLEFRCASIADWSTKVDVIVSCGTIEHMDDPSSTVRRMGSLVPRGGILVLTCPHFLNIRGFVWMALAHLLDVPMSLSDLHFIAPFDVASWIEGTDLTIERHSTFDSSRGNGPLMIADLKKRLPNALRDAQLPTEGVDKFVGWLEKLVEYREASGAPELDGATALYVLRRD